MTEYDLEKENRLIQEGERKKEIIKRRMKRPRKESKV
jgi:hypothetical protein